MNGLSMKQGSLLIRISMSFVFRILELLSADDTNILIGYMIVLLRSLHAYQFHHYQTNKLQVSCTQAEELVQCQFKVYKL